MKTTVICHFFNEEYLLPWWLKFHREIFDHGIMIDYDSTDSSREIVEELVPHWQVVKSRNEWFDAPAIDTEVNEYERSSPGWKTVLNVTEFLCGDLQYAIKRSEIQGIRPRAVSLVDQEHLFGQEPEKHMPIHKQRHYGIVSGPGIDGRRRLLHRYSWVPYGIGRHSWPNNTEDTDLLTVAHLAFSPMTPAFISRKIQIQTKIPDSNKHVGFGFQHLIDRDGVLQQWRAAQKEAEHLPSHRFWRETTRVMC